MTGYTYYLPIAVHHLTSGRLPWAAGDAGPREPVIIIVTDGWARVTLNGTERELERQTAVCCSPKTSLDWIEERAFKGIAIEYRELTLDGMHPNPSGLPEQPLKGPSETLALFGQRMEAAWQRRHEVPLEPQRLLLELLTWLLEQPKQDKDGTEVPWLDNVLSLLRLSYSEEWTREALAAYADVSAEHFSRVFRKETGMTYTAYLNMLRIREAQLLILKGTSLNLNEIARQVGYRDGYYLSKKFKGALGLSPVNYRRKPRRIVTSSYNHTEMLMELGIQPVLGVYSSWSRHRPHEKGEDNVEWELHWSEGSGSYKILERLQPDVIVGTETVKEDRRLYRYAAVESVPMVTMPWREQFRRIGEIAGKRPHAEEIIERYDRKAAESNMKLDAQGVTRGTAAVWEVYADVAYVFHSGYGRGTQVLYEDLGFLIPEQLVRKGMTSKGYLAFPVAEVSDIDCDHLFIVAAHDSIAYRQLLQSESWSRLTAVRQGRVHFMNDFGTFYGIDPRSTELQLETLMDRLVPTS